jgi:hypothetical protein
MATLRREWVSVEQARQWIDTYDPKWMSDQVKDAMAREIKAGKKLRWYHAIIVDAHTNICHEGLTRLLAIVKAEQGQMCWVARADDFHFSESELDRTAQGYQVITRKQDGYGRDDPAQPTLHHRQPGRPAGASPLRRADDSR